MALGIIWDLDDDPDGNVQHIAQHGITKEEADGEFRKRVNPDQFTIVSAGSFSRSNSEGESG